jgi:hypothetical protein
MTKSEDDKNASTSTIREQENVTLQCPKLNDTNYTAWALLMETILKAYGLWDTLEAKEMVDEKKMHTTKAMIFQTLPQDVLMQVGQFSTPKEVWDSIKTRYLGADLVQKARLQTLRSELEALKMKENESVNDFASKLGGIRTKFKSLGNTLKDKVIVRKLLNSVPKKFLPIVATIEQYSEIDEMSFEEAVGRIVAFEERLKSQDEPEDNNHGKLLMASQNNHSENWNQGRGRGYQNRGRGRSSFRGGRSHGRGSNQGDRNKERNEYRCYSCGEYGHFAYECNKEKNKEKEEDQEAHLAWDEEPTLL